jgi:hypothetical protein
MMVTKVLPYKKSKKNSKLDLMMSNLTFWFCISGRPRKESFGYSKIRNSTFTKQNKYSSFSGGHHQSLLGGEEYSFVDREMSAEER